VLQKGAQGQVLPAAAAAAAAAAAQAAPPAPPAAAPAAWGGRPAELPGSGPPRYCLHSCSRCCRCCCCCCCYCGSGRMRGSSAGV